MHVSTKSCYGSGSLQMMMRTMLTAYRSITIFWQELPPQANNNNNNNNDNNNNNNDNN